MSLACKDAASGAQTSALPIHRAAGVRGDNWSLLPQLYGEGRES